MRKLFLALALLGTTAPVLAANSPFAGTWKLDPAKGHYTGTTFTLKQQSGDTYRMEGGAFNFDVKTDGKDHPTVANSTAAWKQTGANSWHIVNKVDGKTTSEIDDTLSADGRTLTENGKGKANDGTPFSFVNTYQRVGSGSGIAGTWKNMKAKVEADQVLNISTPDKESVKLEFTHDKVVVDGKTDGSPAKVTGPHIPEGASGKMRMAGPHSLDYTWSYKDKPFSTGVMKVSTDGKTLTDTSWDPTKPTEKTMDVYNKQ